MNACGLEVVREGKGMDIGSKVKPGVLNLQDGKIQVLILVQIQLGLVQIQHGLVEILEFKVAFRWQIRVDIPVEIRG